MEKIYKIYKIINNINEKIYIGWTNKKLSDRFKNHCDEAKRRNKTYLARALNKYGFENFEIIELCNVERKKILDIEKKFIKKFKSNNSDIGYNMTSGGDGFNGLIRTEEHCRKISEAHKGMKASLETRKKISKALTGKKHSKEAKKKIKKNHAKHWKNHRMIESHKKNIGKSMIGKNRFKMTSEIIEKIRLSNLGKKRSLDTCENIRKSQMGKKLSKEHKRKISKTMKSNIMKKKALKIIEKLKEKSYKAVFAGGCVRDELLELKPHDYDIATNATPDQVESLFEKTIPVGKSFGVIIVVVEKEEFEVATFRFDGIYVNGRRPESVSFSSMREDAERRDLTINGMFLDPVKDKVIDFVGGQEDLDKGIVRLIGDPEKRIEEDKLRMLRVIRFATRFDFEIEEATFNVVRKHAHEITQVSSERIFDELKKMLRKNSRRVIDLLFDTDLISHILPEVKAMDGVQQPPQFHSGDVLEHTLQTLEFLPENASDELLFGALLHDVGKPPTFRVATDRIRFNQHDTVGFEVAKKILKRFKVSNEFSDRVSALVFNHMRFMSVKKMRVAKLKRFLRMENFEEHMALHKADCLASHGGLDNFDFLMEKKEFFPPEEVKPKRLITGHDLIELGFKPGPFFKIVLEAVEDKQLEDEISTKDEAIEFVKMIPTEFKK